MKTIEEYKGFTIIRDDINNRVFVLEKEYNSMSFNIGIPEIHRLTIDKVYCEHAHILLMVNSIKCVIDYYLKTFKEQDDRI